MYHLETDISEQQPLAGQVVLITGGGRGLGRAFAETLAAAGAAVAITSRSAGQLAEAASAITSMGGQVLAIPADVTERHAVTRVVRTVEHTLGPIDLLVNNAGMGDPLGPLWEIDPDLWWRNVEVNLRSVLLCSHAILPSMITRGRGRVINVSSLAALGAIPYGSAYVSSKAALIRLSETLAAETKPYGVSVFSIHPGLVRTAMANYALESPEGQKWWPWYRVMFEMGQDVPPEVAAELVLRLALGDGDALSGRFISVTDDFDAMLKRAHAIEQENLYTLQMPPLVMPALAELMQG